MLALRQWPAGTRRWITSSHGGFYTLKFEVRQPIARLKPAPTPGNEDYRD